METSDFDRISPTAKLVAWLRSFSDIPYAQEICDTCKAEDAAKEILGDNLPMIMWAAPIIEARYKSIDFVLNHYGYSIAVELASGLSPRGMIATLNPAVHYLETDLKDVFAEKFWILRKLIDDLVDRRNFQQSMLDATDEKMFNAALWSYIPVERTGPVAILNEGLLPYLNRDEKAKVAQNIHTYLSKRGGVWITPDISSSKRLQTMLKSKPTAGPIIETVSGLTGRNLESNSFATLKEAEQFYKSFGFKLTKWKQRKIVPWLSSAHKLGISAEKTSLMLEHSSVYALEPK